MDFGVKQKCENCKHADVIYADEYKRKLSGIYCNKYNFRMDLKKYKNLMNCMGFIRKEGL